MAARRSTFQREVILEALQRSGRHVTAAELYQIVRHSVPRLSLGTVYRNLDILYREGLVKKLGTASRETQYDGILDEHYHLRCRKCGRIEDIDAAVSVHVTGAISSASGWEVAEPTVEFHGLCPDCRSGPAELRSTSVLSHK